MTAKPQEQWLSIEEWTASKLKKENIATLKAMNTRFGNNWTHIPNKGRRLPFVKLLMEYKQIWIRERLNGNRAAQDAMRDNNYNNNSNEQVLLDIDQLIGRFGVPPFLDGDEQDSEAPQPGDEQAEAPQPGDGQDEAPQPGDGQDEAPQQDEQEIEQDEQDQQDEQQQDEKQQEGDVEEKQEVDGEDDDMDVMNPVEQWLLEIDLGVHWPTFQAQGCICFDAIDTLDNSDLREMGINMIGHRKILLKHIRLLNEKNNNYNNNNNNNVMDILGDQPQVLGVELQAIDRGQLILSLQGQVFRCIICKCHGLSLSKTRAKIAGTTSAKMFLPIMAKTADDGQKLHTNYKICKSSIYFIADWKLCGIENYRDPQHQAHLGIQAGRGGTRYHTGTLVLKGLSSAYNNLPAERQQIFKAQVIDKFLPWMTKSDWKRHSIRFGDLVEVQELGLLD